MKGSNVSRAVILAVSCLVLGFVGGWTLASIGSDTVSLPDVNLDTTVADTTATETTTGGVTNTTGTGSQTGTVPTPAPVVRSEVTIQVLNGSGVAGRAAGIATQLKGKGWTDVLTGNAEVSAGTTIYYREGSKEAADEVGADLSVTQVTPLEGAAVTTPDASVEVVVVLGT